MDHEHDDATSTAPTAATRRNLLTVAAATAAGVVGAAAFAQPTAAADGDPVLLGEDNSAGSPTRSGNDGPFTDLSGPGPFEVRMRVRLPEDDED